MSGEELALDFLAALRGDAPPPSAAATRGPRLGTVHASYSGTGAARVTFDGEVSAGLRSYIPLQPVAVGQRVVLLPIGNTFVILGDVAEALRLRLAGLDARVLDLETRVGGSVARSNTTRTFAPTTWHVLNTAADWVESVSRSGGVAAFDGTWVAPEGGVYLIEAGIHFSATINLIVAVKLNNSAASSAGALMSSSTVGVSLYTAAAVSGERRLSAGDVLRVAIFPSGYAGSAAWTPSSSLTAAAAGFFGFRKVAD